MKPIVCPHCNIAFLSIGTVIEPSDYYCPECGLNIEDTYYNYLSQVIQESESLQNNGLPPLSFLPQEKSGIDIKDYELPKIDMVQLANKILHPDVKTEKKTLNRFDMIDFDILL